MSPLLPSLASAPRLSDPSFVFLLTSFLCSHALAAHSPFSSAFRVVRVPAHSFPLPPGSPQASTTNTGVDLGPASTTYTTGGVEPYGAGVTSDLGSSATHSSSVDLGPASTTYSSSSAPNPTARARRPTSGTPPNPTPLATPTRDDSIMVQTGHSVTSLASQGWDDSVAAHTGHTVEDGATGPVRATHPAAQGASTPEEEGRRPPPPPSPSSASVQRVSESPAPLTPGASTDLALNPSSSLHKTGSAALNSSRLEDNVPTGDPDWAERFSSGETGVEEGSVAPSNSPAEGEAPSALTGLGAANGVQKTGSAALNSSRFEDNVPTGDADGEEDEDESDEDGEGDEGEEDAGSAQTAGTEPGGGGKGKGSGKKEKLMRRLKEKMHVGAN
ncbi:hypothetical protein B0H14DRAFT_3899317 [Mycena olivaceomarginata]|nr:hypothetical protein B0H14DRAFT_3899317 [Mycena olivaceomarginata]